MGSQLHGKYARVVMLIRYVNEWVESSTLKRTNHNLVSVLQLRETKLCSYRRDRITSVYVILAKLITKV